MEIKHAFTSAKADGPDSTRVRPSAWNDDHVVTATGPSFIGRTAAGPGVMEEIPLNRVLPLGVVLPFAPLTAPAGWLLSFGQLVNRVTYADLFTALGTTYGAGDGVTTFGLPDLRGVVPAGKSNMGGSDRGILPGGTVLGAFLGGATNAAGVTVTGVSGSISGSTFGSLALSMGGASALSQAPQVGPDLLNFAVDHVHSGSTSGSLGVTGSFSGSGGGVTAAFSIVQPTIVLNYIINTGV